MLGVVHKREVAIDQVKHQLRARSEEVPAIVIEYSVLAAEAKPKLLEYFSDFRGRCSGYNFRALWVLTSSVNRGGAC